MGVAPKWLAIHLLFLSFKTCFLATSVIQENTAARFYCDAPEMFHGKQNHHLSFHQREGEQIMTAFSFIGEQLQCLPCTVSCVYSVSMLLLTIQTDGNIAVFEGSLFHKPERQGIILVEPLMHLIVKYFTVEQSSWLTFNRLLTIPSAVHIKFTWLTSPVGTSSPQTERSSVISKLVDTVEVEKETGQTDHSAVSQPATQLQRYNSCFS